MRKKCFDKPMTANDPFTVYHVQTRSCDLPLRNLSSRFLVWDSVPAFLYIPSSRIPVLYIDTYISYYQIAIETTVTINDWHCPCHLSYTRTLNFRNSEMFRNKKNQDVQGLIFKVLKADILYFKLSISPQMYNVSQSIIKHSWCVI